MRYTYYMDTLSIAPSYIRWHYTRGFVEAFGFTRRLLASVISFFSLPLLLHTFASPWKRESEGYKKNEPTSWLGTFIFNTLMRLLGIGIRSLIMLFGAAVFLCALGVSACVYIFWLAAPFLVLASFVLGIIELLH